MEELIDLYNSYLSIDKISKMKNISPYKVAQYLKRMELMLLEEDVELQ